ncbi:MAG TPA: fluoride efflux transporter CrcB [Burkholderiales bacterium]|nr:fluoride efflux transporter CrcB [Burkholderiales bacterium]
MSFSGFIAVGGGAAAGAWLRWWLGMLLNPFFPTLPLGTLAANLLGGWLMGLAMGLFGHFEGLPPEMRLFLMTGFLGGLTTFSTFSAETATLISHEQYGWTAAIIAVHVIGSVLMTLLGMLMIGLVLKR